MFKLKSGNVVEKIKKMDRKQAYTLGAIVIVLFVALLTISSMMGDADDTSFDGLSTQQYDLAQMPFLNDESEAYLLASQYPDMKDNQASALYSPEEKAARQAQDAQDAEEEEEEEEEESTTSFGGGSRVTARDSSEGYGGRNYGGRNYRGRQGGGTKTEIKQLGSANAGRASGGGVNSTWGAPKGDFSPWKSQDKGKEITAPPQLKTNDAKKSLSQFAQASKAAAAFKEGKSGNAKRAMMGGEVKGSEAFGGQGVELDITKGLTLDTNAPISSPSMATPDLTDAESSINDKAKKAEEDKKKQEEQLSFWDKLWQGALQGLINGVVNFATSYLDRGLNNGDWHIGKAKSSSGGSDDKAKDVGD